MRTSEYWAGKIQSALAAQGSGTDPDAQACMANALAATDASEITDPDAFGQTLAEGNMGPQTKASAEWHNKILAVADPWPAPDNQPPEVYRYAAGTLAATDATKITDVPAFSDNINML